MIGLAIALALVTSPGPEMTRQWNATGGVSTDNCLLGSTSYESCIRSREKALNQTSTYINTIEPASGNRTITGTNNIRIEQRNAVGAAGTVANPAQQ